MCVCFNVWSTSLAHVMCVQACVCVCVPSPCACVCVNTCPEELDNYLSDKAKCGYLETAVVIKMHNGLSLAAVNSKT